MPDKKEFSTLVAGVCFIAMLALIVLSGALAIGVAVGYRQAKALYDKPSMPIIRQGEFPFNVPVMVYTIRDDGTITAESAIRTDYAGVLPFSTTGKAVDLYGIGDYDYWTELSAVVRREP